MCCESEKKGFTQGQSVVLVYRRVGLSTGYISPRFQEGAMNDTGYHIPACGCCFGGILLMFVAAVAGCEQSTTPRQRAESPVPAGVKAHPVPDPRPRLEAPIPSRFHYDDQTRTLRSYELHERSARWMVLLPNEPHGLPLQKVHPIPSSVPADQVIILYTVPGGGTSPAISLADIRNSGLHAQR